MNSYFNSTWQNIGDFSKKFNVYQTFIETLESLSLSSTKSNNLSSLIFKRLVGIKTKKRNIL